MSVAAAQNAYLKYGLA